MRNRVFSLLMTIVLLCGMVPMAFAHEVPDPERNGSIQITMHSGNTKVGGGSLTLYRVGEVDEDDGNYSFVPTGSFADCGESFGNLESSAKLAERLADYADEHNVNGTTKTIDSKGSVSFTDLELGLYLLVQEKAASGYSKASPFLVSVPQNENGAYVYAVEASPKVEVEPAPTSPTSSTKPTSSSSSTTPTKPTKLPETGQLNWPVPVLAVLGLCVFALGWVLRKKDSHEE